MEQCMAGTQPVDIARLWYHSDKCKWVAALTDSVVSHGYNPRGRLGGAYLP